MRYRRIVLVVAFGASLPATAAPPNMNDYAQGVVVEAYGATPLLELALPDPVYQRVTRADLRDVRVFNAEGTPVPHAFCAAPEATTPVVTEESLPVFELKSAARTEDSARIEVETAGGTQVNVQEPGRENGAADRDGRTHIIDARPIEESLRAIQFDWSSPDGASEAQVRIEASDDLDRWRTVVASSTLLRADKGEQTLRRERIELPLQSYEYLRVQRADGGPPLILNGVVAERVAKAPEIEPLWFMPEALKAEEPHVLLFDAARVAPVRYARLRMPQDNSSISLTLQNRPDEKAPWRERWSGEAYTIVSNTERRESPPARFAPTSDRHWRVLLPRDAAPSSLPTLELGYRPLQLRFLAQGPAPYTVAFGSRRAELASPSACDGLLADVAAEERRGMITDAYPGELKTLGGDAALKPLPKKTPTRVVVLWSVLVVGVGLLVAMAASLLKRVRTDEGTRD
jgi:hypothetical protein